VSADQRNETGAVLRVAAPRRSAPTIVSFLMIALH
jgi:hypothetical protein